MLKVKDICLAGMVIVLVVVVNILLFSLAPDLSSSKYRLANCNQVWVESSKKGWQELYESCDVKNDKDQTVAMIASTSIGFLKDDMVVKIK